MGCRNTLEPWVSPRVDAYGTLTLRVSGGLHHVSTSFGLRH